VREADSQRLGFFRRAPKMHFSRFLQPPESRSSPNMSEESKSLKRRRDVGFGKSGKESKDDVSCRFLCAGIGL
jgi:hypothetical protein